METTTSSANGTPPHLWAVAIVALLWNGFGAYDYLATVLPIESYMARFSAEQRAYMDSYPVWATGAWAIAIWSSVLGSIALLLRKDWAVWLFAVALGGMVISYIYILLLSDGMEIMGSSAVVLSLVIFAVAIGLFLYSRAMAAKGVLT